MEQGRGCGSGPTPMQIKIVQGFAFAHRGVEVKQYEAGAVVDATDGELIDVALREGWARPLEAPERAAMPAAPERKSKRGIKE